MRLVSCFILPAALLFATASPALTTPHPHRGPTAPRHSRLAHLARVTHLSISRLSRRHASARSEAKAAPAGISSARATQIQTALIRAGYLSGEPSGVWDASTQAAMEKLQSDNGWQTKLVPDSRAIIKLGLGPNTSSESGVAEGFSRTGDTAAAENR